MRKWGLVAKARFLGPNLWRASSLEKGMLAAKSCTLVRRLAEAAAAMSAKAKVFILVC